MDVLLGVVLLGLSVGLAVLIFFARQGRFSSRTLVTLAALCSGALILMLASDWPSGLLSGFWSGHPVLEGVLGTLLLVGVGFFAFELREAQEDSRLDASLTAAGFGGLVDYAVDVEVALALVTGCTRPDQLGWSGWEEEQRPLRWLRHRRRELLGTVDQRANPHDPRATAATVGSDRVLEDWQIALVDQSVRRLLGGIRDWSPVVDRSRNGRELLVTLAYIRNELVRLGSHGAPFTLAMSLRHLCRVLALHMEQNSAHAMILRPEVLTCLDGLSLRDLDLAGLDRVVTPGWARQLHDTNQGMLRN